MDFLKFLLAHAYLWIVTAGWSLKIGYIWLDSLLSRFIIVIEAGWTAKMSSGGRRMGVLLCPVFKTMPPVPGGQEAKIPDLSEER